MHDNSVGMSFKEIAIALEQMTLIVDKKRDSYVFYDSNKDEKNKNHLFIIRKVPQNKITKI